ncbi:hypothetical protein J7E88_32765 [Streptomyces sp. ISL-10]|uniref:hypothetical protein n=1 Tax=Streptomyces sp. ISL-10 TaxID=2819172 RepID=UPI001BE95053|nr:hypothetical protein [Streptomyces sp. ISL-10]MBT2369920.1 hypothetical protein [Streptomyces sp. ISL-10]
MLYFVALMTLVALVNLIFTMGVVRRLREHTQLINDRLHDAVVPPPTGKVAHDFTVDTIDGTTVSRTSLNSPLVAGFFTPQCKACVIQASEFIDYAATVPGGRDSVVAVISGTGPEAEEYAAQFADVAHVVVEEPFGPVQLAFSVDGYPAFAAVTRHGAVTFSGREVRDLPTTVSA